ALPDHDRARAEDEDALDVVSAWHGCGLSFALPALEADRGDGDGDEPAPHDPGYDDEGDYGGARHVCSRQVVRDRIPGGESAGRAGAPQGEGGVGGRAGLRRVRLLLPAPPGRGSERRIGADGRGAAASCIDRLTAAELRHA